MTKSGQLYSRNLVVGSITDTSHCRPLGLRTRDFIGNSTHWKERL
jgi:hypothetical protein